MASEPPMTAASRMAHYLAGRDDIDPATRSSLVWIVRTIEEESWAGAEAELLALRPLWDAALAWYRVVDDQVWGDELSPETLALVEAVRDRLVEEAG